MSPPWKSSEVWASWRNLSQHSFFAWDRERNMSLEVTSLDWPLSFFRRFSAIGLGWAVLYTFRFKNHSKKDRSMQECFLYRDWLCRSQNPPLAPTGRRRNWHLSHWNGHCDEVVVLAGRSRWTPCCCPPLLPLPPPANWSRFRTTAPRWSGAPAPQSRQPLRGNWQATEH